ncbi:MAG: T9SS type A sorting domain-containing protein [Bacteroidia bacterium]|nr:T9SS type A sorting domain-containing protein [Bacteroidia bacterium]
MKKIYSLLLFTLLSFSIKATSYTITTVGTTYSPASLTVTVGDVITINANANHPTAEVSQTTWNANGTATLSTGFGVKTSSYTFTVTNAGEIYYVCTNHVSMGMKGMITVTGPTSISELGTTISNVKLFPNPVKNNLSVQFNASIEGNVSAKIYSICGKEVETLSINQDFQAGVTTLNFNLQNKIPAGIYFIQLNSQSKTITKKFIVE